MRGGANGGPSELGNHSLAANQYFWFPVNAYGNGTKLKFTISASDIVDIMVMNQQQFASFKVNGSTSAIYRNVVSNLTETVALPSGGKYYLVVFNDQLLASVNVDVDYGTIPVDIYGVRSSVPVPTGIADYGIENSSGTYLAYEQAASSVTGSATLNSVAAYNSTAPTLTADPYGASLQLNVVLRLNTTSGQRVYWLQNVLEMLTNTDTGEFVDNIWNVSAPDARLDDARIAGNGGVQPAENTNAYLFSAGEFTYLTPLNVRMPIAVSRTGNAAVIAFSYAESSGAQPPGPASNYDMVTITEDHPILDAALIVSGFEKTPGGIFYDAEFVFGGEVNGEATTFTSMNSTLEVSYTLTDGSVAAPRSAFEFGGDTAEAAYNLQTTQVRGAYVVGLGRISFSQDYIQSYGPGPTARVPLTVSYSISDGTAPSTPPTLTFVVNGTQHSVTLGTTPTTYSVDNGSTWTVTSTLLGKSGERWFYPGASGGSATTAQTLALVYYHQYLVSATYTISGGGQPGPPSLTSTADGTKFESPLRLQNFNFWLDSGSNWTVTNPLNGSTPSQRWFASTGNSGTVSAGLAIDPIYVNQFSVTLHLDIVGGGAAGNATVEGTVFGVSSPLQVGRLGIATWLDAGSSLTIGQLTTGSTASERWVTNSSALTVTASFTASLAYQHEYYVRVQTTAPSGTSVSPDSGWFGAGSTVKLNASTDLPWMFERWTGVGASSYSGPDAMATFALASPANETAVFYPGIEISAGEGGRVSYTAGPTTGTVQPGSSVVAFVPPGTSVVLTALPDFLRSLSGWSGLVSGNSQTTTVSVRAPSEVSATFGLNLEELGSIAGVAVVLLVVAAVAMGRRRRRRPTRETFTGVPR